MQLSNNFFSINIIQNIYDNRFVINMIADHYKNNLFILGRHMS